MFLIINKWVSNLTHGTMKLKLMTLAFFATALVNMIHKTNSPAYLRRSNILSSSHTLYVLLCVRFTWTWLSLPDPCLVLIFSSLVLFNLYTGHFPQSTLQVQTKRRLTVDLTDNFTALLVLLRILSATVRSLSLFFLAHTHSFFFFFLSHHFHFFVAWLIFLLWTAFLSDVCSLSGRPPSP